MGDEGRKPNTPVADNQVTRASWVTYIRSDFKGSSELFCTRSYFLMCINLNHIFRHYRLKE
jgi:hypothetical protein